jgi:hypothetical protein
LGYLGKGLNFLGRDGTTCGGNMREHILKYVKNCGENMGQIWRNLESFEGKI